MTTARAISARRKSGQRGIEITEFALFSILLFPLFLGVTSTGVALGKAIQTAQVARDAGHMFVRQVDFSQNANKDLIVRVAKGLNMTRADGNGKVTLSQVLMIGPNECAAGGLTTAQCGNLNFAVITQRIVIGNNNLTQSTVGNPSATLFGSDGTATPAAYLTDPSFRANTLTNANGTGLLTLQQSERTYISEAYFVAPELSFLNRGQSLTMYSRNYF